MVCVSLKIKNSRPAWESLTKIYLLIQGKCEKSMYICIYKCCNDMNVEAILKTKKELPLPSRTIIHLMLVGNKINEAVTQALKPLDISPEQFNVLRILRGRKGKPANLCTLNERMITKMSNTTRLVDKLLQKGYVNRSVCKVNRRKIEITITPEGLEALGAMDVAVAEAEKGLIEGFTKEEMEQLNILLDHF